jgi:hypothetical protein
VPHSWSSLPAPALYRWILSVLRSFPPSSPPSLLHVRAHTDASDSPSRANALVDRVASSAHSLLINPPPVPLPTFFMDRFTPYLPPFQFIDSRFAGLLHSLLASRSFHDLAFTPFHTLTSFFHDSHTAPSHPYIRASSAYSAVIQLYARSSQLPTRTILATRFRDRSPFCRFGCASLEDPHHLFVTCPAFHGLRAEYSHALVSDISRALGGSTLPPSLAPHLERVAAHLFHDNECWPLGSSRFFLGILPPLLPATCVPSSLSLDANRLVSRVAHSCHMSAIHLAARIWGLVTRHHTSNASAPPSQERSRDADLVLPDHLRHLLHS